MKKKILVIGPVTKDVIITPSDSYNQIGGSVYYITNILSQLNEYSTSIISIGKDDHELLSQIKNNTEIKIIDYEKTMEYTNTYTDKTTRQQRASLPENSITPDKITKLDIDLEEYEYVILAPLSKHDIPLETIEYLKKQNLKTIILAQGYIRTTDNNDNIAYTQWDNYEDYLEYSDIIIMDNEEAIKAFDLNEINTEWIIGLINEYNLNTIIITKSIDGSDIYTKTSLIRIPAVSTDNYVDPTGLGDTYIGAYISKIQETKSKHTAGVYASICAKKKLECKGKLEINKKEVEEELKRLL
ncbi:MAG: PfkB family carbohydrate kinase [Methanosphaera sp.]|nr:PfkB family carbohydrate kinase [Methanosphaera sp.]